MEISLAAEKIAHLGPIPITNSMATSWIATAILIVLGYFAARNLKSIPRGIQNVFEMIVEMLFGMINSIFNNKDETKRYFPYLATVFLFIITNNWLGIFPGVGSIGFHEHGIFVPIFRSGNADLNTTLALAILTIILVQVYGIVAIGFGSYSSKFFNFKSPVLFFVGILELMSEFSRIISFSFRLFGNIFAGEVLLGVITMLLPYVGPVPFYMLELFVGFIQALVFMMLASVFIKLAITSHDAHADEPAIA
ncbi:ATP synthase F0 subunit A [Candidatus Berkelbacteria bacterium CG10_big_fil_rev_8_21_14_0_10_43_13]|uniref:ATP synthase subunit a n=1 Tax=Candidatus Berkelbacteria bacterium CG10_big_fil_rev_8_21_14_0_10_43_13 TaxID=1974514 RepID=A0A2H0W5Z7_9BACT|nr:F0F1 ATP synthase subunit A [bacterium]PIS07506.1 MAG: ATP synthase F0 subunit A [Candidatus Berkelbacteria bacterium CG10_big_fil_rev_8_21_14_0_10_43_13]